MYKHVQGHRSNMKRRGSARGRSTGKNFLFLHKYRNIIAYTFGLISIIASLIFVVQFGFSRWQNQQISDQKIVFYSVENNEYTDKILIAEIFDEGLKIQVQEVGASLATSSNNTAIPASIPATTSAQLRPTQLAFELGIVAPMYPVREKIPPVHNKTSFKQLLNTVQSEQNDRLAQLKWWWQTRIWRFIPAGNWHHIEYKNLEEWRQGLANRAQPITGRDCNITVVNTTDSSGLARTVTAILEQTGMFVIRTADSFSFQPKTNIVVADTNACLAEQELLKNFIPSMEEAIEAPELAHQFRAEIVLQLGEDVAGVYQDYLSTQVPDQPVEAETEISN